MPGTESQNQEKRSEQNQEIIEISLPSCSSKTSEPATKKSAFDALKQPPMKRSSSEPPNERNPKKLRLIQEFVMKTRPDMKKQLDHQVGKFIYSTNTSFLAVEHREFKKLVQTLRPGYIPPTRKQIGGQIFGRFVPNGNKIVQGLLRR